MSESHLSGKDARRQPSQDTSGECGARQERPSNPPVQINDPVTLAQANVDLLLERSKYGDD